MKCSLAYFLATNFEALEKRIESQLWLLGFTLHIGSALKNQARTFIENFEFCFFQKKRQRRPSTWNERQSRCLLKDIHGTEM